MDTVAIGSQRTDELQRTQRLGQSVLSGTKGAIPEVKGDTVSISEEGRMKSTAMLASASADSAGKSSGVGVTSSSSGSSASVSSVSSSSAASVDVADLEKELQTKQTEVSSKEAKVEAAKQAAASDPSKQSEVRRLQNQLSDLEDEASKIQSEIYTS